MKKYIFAALALLAIACAKEDVEQQPAPQPITINVADFPTTRADSYGKTAWEAGDKLMVSIIDNTEGNPIGLYTLTYNGTSWSIDTPIDDLTVYEELTIQATYCPNMQMEWSEEWIEYFITKATEEQNPYLSEYLCDMYCYFDPGTNTINIPFIDFARNNRIRVNYTPNTEIKVSLHRVDYAIHPLWLAREFNDEDYEDVEFNVTTDNDGNAFIYAMWNGYSITPNEFVSNPTITIKSSNGSKTLKTANLPYTEGYFWATYPHNGGRAFVLTVPQE